MFDFYRPFGYQPAFTLHTIAFTEQQPIMQKGLRAMTPQDLPACEALYRSQLADRPLTVLRTPEQWQAQLTMFEALGGSALVLEHEDAILGYAFVWKEENGIWAQELICRSSKPICCYQHFWHRPDKRSFAPVCRLVQTAQRSAVSGGIIKKLLSRQMAI